MNARRFLAEFGHLANAPGGVARLRDLVLQLAISGRLVERVEADTPVDASLASAAAERAAYESEHELRTTPHHSPVDTSPFSIPDHWRWVRLEQLALYIQRGKGPKYAERGAVLVVSQKCVQWSGFDIAPARWIADDSIDAYGRERFLCEGDLLWNSTGTGTAGRVAIFQGVAKHQAVADSHVTVVRLANSVPRFVWCVLASPWVQVRIDPTHPASLVSGTTQQVELATSTARTLVVPCPPVEEQYRIVAEVDELMALCDQLEQEQHGRRKLQNALRQSILLALAGAQSPCELETSYERLRSNFGYLFSEPADTADLEQTIKHLALKGLLTSARDGEQVSDHLIDLAELSVVVSAAEDDWPIPSHWIWARCAWLGEARLGKMLDASKNKGELRPYLRNINVRWHRFDLGDVLMMRVEEHELQRVSVKRGDLVICEGGEPGRAAVWSSDEEFVIQKALHRFRCGPDVLPEFMLFCLEHDYSSGRLARYYTGATIKHLTGKALAEYSIPLPPIDEQRRILEAADAMSSIVAIFRDELRAARRVGEIYAKVAVAALTGVNIEHDEETAVKAPQTELIAPLRLATPPDVKAPAPLATILAHHKGELTARDLWQRFGGEIDDFYAQLKTEVAHGWIAEPEVAKVREKLAAEAARA